MPTTVGSSSASVFRGTIWLRATIKTFIRHTADRIVSIHQPQVRPMVRGKANKAVEFGAKFSVSLNGEGMAGVDRICWDAYHEGLDLPAQVEIYKERYGHYPEVVLGDPLYGTRDNRERQV